MASVCTCTAYAVGWRGCDGVWQIVSDAECGSSSKNTREAVVIISGLGIKTGPLLDSAAAYSFPYAACWSCASIVCSVFLFFFCSLSSLFRFIILYRPSSDAKINEWLKIKIAIFISIIFYFSVKCVAQKIAIKNVQQTTECSHRKNINGNILSRSWLHCGRQILTLYKSGSKREAILSDD